MVFPCWDRSSRFRLTQGDGIMTAIYNLSVDDLSIDSSEARNTAAPYAAAYQAAKPYNHICIDNFLPVEILENVEADLRSLPETESSFDRDQERLKTAYSPDRLPFYSKSLFHALNSRPFIFFLEQLTGIKGLIPDPYYMGAGIHRVANGGHLDIHADFNLHAPMQIERRLNVLIYLNRDWREEWGGSFEVWNKAMTTQGGELRADLQPHGLLQHGLRHVSRQPYAGESARRRAEAFDRALLLYRDVGTASQVAHDALQATSRHRG